MTLRYSPHELAAALGIFAPTDEQAAVIAAPPGPLVVIAGAGAGKTETMAARVVWLVANGYARPGEVLGLTFTRKAAGQLLRRVRTRLARLSGTGILDGAVAADEPPTVSTYHAFAGNLLREHGLLLPVEPETRLLSETELWQLAFRVVCEHPELHTEKTPAAVTSMVIRLAGQLAEHLVDTDQLRDTHVELERLVHTLPAGPYQRDRGPSQWLLRLLATQTERTELVPLIDALHQRMRAEKVMDFGMQMASAARLAENFPHVGEQLRVRYRVVLLDEYQDTGHAQRVALSSLFGGGADDGLALTAVGDPVQSIYGWRGASATNLPRFTTDFPRSDGTPAPTLELRTSWRNPPRALYLANAVSAQARRRSVAVRSLLPRPDAHPGTIRCALLNNVAAEREWLADHVAGVYHGARADGVPTPTTAVLVRRNADAAPMADVLTARGVPVEVVGLAGLLGVPEVADVVAMLRLIADPTAGSAAMRVLTGPRWRLGGRDITALWRRAVQLDGTGSVESAGAAERIAAQAAPDADTACLAEAVTDPGAAEAYSPTGYARIVALGRELTALRAHLSNPLPELVAEVRRVLGVDTEVHARRPVSAGWSGTEHLDAFADVVADFASRPGTGVTGLLAYLEAAEEVENGLAPAVGAPPPRSEGGTPVATDRVQILTIHAAKGLEWQVVAVPHLSGRVFPSTGATRTWLTDAGDLPPLLRGDRATLSEHGVPVLDTTDVNDRKRLSDVIAEHKKNLEQRRIDEERRLLYVALTRAEDTLLLSGHHWGAAESKARGPSAFLCELKDIIDKSAAAGEPCGVVEQWAPTPADGEPNPLRDKVIEAAWPVDPAGSHRGDVDRGAALVAKAMAGACEDSAVDSDEGWVADVDALIVERDRVTDHPAPPLPLQVSVSTHGGTGQRSRVRRAATASPPADASRSACVAGHGLSRLGAALLPCRAAVRPRRSAGRGRPRHRRGRRTRRTAGGVRGVAVGRADPDRRRGAVRDGHRRAGGAGPHRRGVRRRRRRRDRGGLEDRRTAEHTGGQAAQRDSAGRVPAGVGGAARLPGVESVRAAFHYVRSGRTVTPDTLPGVDELGRDCWRRPKTLR